MQHKVSPFPVRDWYNRFYTSQDEINRAAMKGLVVRSEQSTQYGTWYTYSTIDGKQICKFYKDSSFGFCSQAYGVEIPNPYTLFS
jgi:hypothetical protein